MGASWLHQRLSLLRKAGHCPLLQLPWSLLIAAGGDTIHSVGVSLPAPGDTVVMRASSSHLLWSWTACSRTLARREGGSPSLPMSLSLCLFSAAWAIGLDGALPLPSQQRWGPQAQQPAPSPPSGFHRVTFCRDPMKFLALFWNAQFLVSGANAFSSLLDYFL